MASNRHEEALVEFNQQINKLRQVLAECLNIKPDQAIFEDLVVPGNPSQTYLRCWWNILVEVEDFRANMNKWFYPTKIKAGLIGAYISETISPVFARFLYLQVAYVLMDHRPTIAELKALSFKCPAAYVRVKNQEEDKLFYADVTTGKCKEVILRYHSLIDVFPWEEKKINQLDGYFAEDLEVAERAAGYVLPKFDHNVFKVFQVARRVLIWAAANINGDAYQFSSEKLLPVIDEFKKAFWLDLIPFDILAIVRQFIESIPVVTIDNYINPNSKEEFSLNGHLGLAKKLLDEAIEGYSQYHKEMLRSSPLLNFFKSKWNRQQRAEKDIFLDKLAFKYVLR